MHFFTADTHFQHHNIIDATARPFADVDAMDGTMLDGIRARVGPDDDLWILGDFGHATATRLPAVRAIFDAIPGRKHLIRGNHDTKHCLSLPWTSVQDMQMITLDEGHFFLCHYPMRAWPSAYHGVIHLFGHVHNAWSGCRRSINLGVEWWNYAPASPAEILDRAATLPDLPPWSGAQGAAAVTAS